MKLIKTKFEGLYLFEKKTYPDNRGFFRELYLEKFLKKKFIFDAMSFSKKMF